MLFRSESGERLFIPARLEDNPYLDIGEYEQSLKELDPVTREQLRHGNWEVNPEGKKFKKEWFKIVKDFPRDFRKIVRFWDMAATEPKKSIDPDYTSGTLICEKDGQYWIIDITRTRSTPLMVEKLIRQTAQLDHSISAKVEIFMEQEPGASGKSMIDHYARDVLKGYAFKGEKTTGSKEVRANPLSAAAENGNVFIVEGSWNYSFLEEICAFPTRGVHDDQVDSTSGAFGQVNQRATIFIGKAGPR